MFQTELVCGIICNSFKVVKELRLPNVSNRVGLWYNLQLDDALAEAAKYFVSNRVGLWYNLQLSQIWPILWVFGYGLEVLIFPL